VSDSDRSSGPSFNTRLTSRTMKYGSCEAIWA
jgi:hypothetical protein